MRTKQTNNIIAHHPVLGNLACEAELSFNAEHYYSAISCIFVLTEAMLKYALSIEDNARFVDVIDRACESDLITTQEKTSLHTLRKLRNGYFHGNPFSQAIDIEDISYIFSENETQKKIYKLYSGTVIDIAERIVVSDDI